jgi:pimeloyl-ACP methyl ester carboxylesterase
VIRTSPHATIECVAHHHVTVNGTELHYVSAGQTGSPILLVHGFPESWWVFHKLIPILSEDHRVFAVDLRGFGDSANGEGAYDSATSADDLVQLITHLDVGPLHVTGQDISGPTTFRVVSSHPELVLSYAAIETGLPGFGMEMLADVTHGGGWHIGVLVAPGIPEMLLVGRERPFIADYAIPARLEYLCVRLGFDLKELRELGRVDQAGPVGRDEQAARPTDKSESCA